MYVVEGQRMQWSSLPCSPKDQSSKLHPGFSPPCFILRSWNTGRSTPTRSASLPPPHALVPASSPEQPDLWPGIETPHMSHQITGKELKRVVENIHVIVRKGEPCCKLWRWCRWCSWRSPSSRSVTASSRRRIRERCSCNNQELSCGDP